MPTRPLTPEVTALDEDVNCRHDPPVWCRDDCRVITRTKQHIFAATQPLDDPIDQTELACTADRPGRCARNRDDGSPFRSGTVVP
jgi:hypothetical protein